MLQASSTEVDLGTIAFGQSYEMSYVLTNTYEKPVNITKLVLGCGSCTKAHVDKTRLLPGQAVMVHATFTPGSTGIQNKLINVVHNLEGKFLPALVLKFKAIVNA